jgi:hypothetical protein
MKRVIWAAKMAKAHDFIKHMKDVLGVEKAGFLGIYD